MIQWKHVILGHRITVGWTVEHVKPSAFFHKGETMEYIGRYLEGLKTHACCLILVVLFVYGGATGELSWYWAVVLAFVAMCCMCLRSAVASESRKITAKIKDSVLKLKES